jgi:hypothetical protein
MSMLDPIVGFFDKLIDQFTWRRLIFLAVTLIVLAMSLWAYESYTQSFKLTRLERQVNLLQKLGTVTSSPEIRSNPELQALSKAIAKQIKDTDITAPVSYELLPWTKKALAAAVAWLIFGLFIALIPNNYTSTQPAQVPS